MHFSSKYSRPPFEKGTVCLQVTSGCSHATCNFCGFFKDSIFKKSPISEIEEDIKELSRSNLSVDRIYLQGADAFAADYDVLMKTAELVHRYLPRIKSIGGYARIDNFLNKSEDQIKNLYDLGYENPFIGVESGDNYILNFINKGYDSNMARDVLLKLNTAGMPIVTNFLNGIAPAGYGMLNGINTSKLYQNLKLTRIAISSLTLDPMTIIYRMVKENTHTLMPEIDRLWEIYYFMKNLDCDVNEIYFHRSVPFCSDEMIIFNKHELLCQLKNFIYNNNESELVLWRSKVKKL